ncbi:hypothetical protein C8R45DRAFT_324700 [Mycena sanguinolenta]|nr:hypothetical protein C8R45DRAFT_324700 [Mycena sanguinolenta]
MDIHEMERDFCSNFKCCHVKLSNLHALFDHLNSCHPGSDINDLSFSVPCLGTSTSDVMQIPAPPSSPRKLKSLFTRVPLPPIPPFSPIDSDSLCTSLSSPPQQLSSASSSNSQSSQHSMSNSGACSSAHAPAPRPENSPTTSIPPATSVPPPTPSMLTRDRIYTPVAIPWTLRPDPSQAMTWRVSAPTAFYPEAAGYGYGYCYFPAIPIIPHVPVPPAPAPKAGAPSNPEIIDVDLIPSPQPTPRPSAAPLPDASASALPSPSPSVVSSGASAPPASASSRAPPPPPSQSSPSARDLLLQAGKGRITSANSGSTNPASATLMEVVETTANRDDAGCKQAPVAAAVPALHEDTTLGGGASGGDMASHTPEDGANTISGQMSDAQDLKDDSSDDTVEADTTPNSPIPTKAPRYLHGKEKIYVCPIPLCVKAYLNPNGLRYHALKGTCVKEDGTRCPTSLSISHDSFISWPASAGETVSPSATTSEALSPASPACSPSALPPPRRRPPRQSARLASSSAAKESAAAGKGATRGCVKTRSKAKSKLKTQTQLKTKTAPKPKASMTTACSPSPAASSPWSSYSHNSDLDSDDSDAEMSSDD